MKSVLVVTEGGDLLPLYVDEKPRKFISQNEYVSEDVPEPKDKVSLTQPNLAYTIQEIMVKYSQGQPIPGSMSEAIYTGELLVPDKRRMDFVDVDEYKRYLANEISRLEEQKNKFLENEKKRREAARRKSIEDVYDEQITKLKSKIEQEDAKGASK